MLAVHVVVVSLVADLNFKLLALAHDLFYLGLQLLPADVVVICKRRRQVVLVSEERSSYVRALSAEPLGLATLRQIIR